jgi:hypothetical protein
MARYFFDVSNGAGGAWDDSGTDLPDHRAAIAYRHEIAHELMRNNEQGSRQFCITAGDEARELLFSLLFVGPYETTSHLPPGSRMLLEVCYERRRKLPEAMCGARKTIRQSRAVVAPSRRKPYLAAVGGQACP